MQHATGVIHDEHRSIGQVLQQMTALVDESTVRAAALDCAPLKAMLQYLRAFPEVQHHPKEDDYLFRLLQQRTGEVNDIIDELRRQHVAGLEWLDRLEAALAHFEKGFPDAFTEFASVLHDYCALQRRHMQMEENAILPAAQRHLSAQDWNEIATAFGKNGDPRFDPAKDKAFHNRQERISRLVEASGSCT